MGEDQEDLEEARRDLEVLGVLLLDLGLLEGLGEGIRVSEGEASRLLEHKILGALEVLNLEANLQDLEGQLNRASVELRQPDSEGSGEAKQQLASEPNLPHSQLAVALAEALNQLASEGLKLDLGVNRQDSEASNNNPGSEELSSLDSEEQLSRQVWADSEALRAQALPVAEEDGILPQALEGLLEELLDLEALEDRLQGSEQGLLDSVGEEE